MTTKPITPTLHGVLDYVFSGVQLAGPASLGLSKSITTTYQLLGLGFLGVNAFTDTPVGIKPALSFQDHRKTDASFLTTLSLLTFVNFIRRDERALAFHLGFLGTAVANYLLTDYKASTK